jgi:hypothetical protein
VYARLLIFDLVGTVQTKDEIESQYNVVSNSCSGSVKSYLEDFQTVASSAIVCSEHNDERVVCRTPL